MAKLRLCPLCANEFASRRPYCTHCGRPAYYANVDAAAEPREEEALADRYHAALVDAEARGAAAETAAFEAVSRSTKAVASRWFGEVERLADDDGNIYTSYYDKLEGGLEEPASNEWNRLRVIMDEALFPGYKRSIRFAVMSSTGEGPPGYGDCHITLREEMIGHRATVFEENSLLWVRDHMRISGLEIILPAGSQAVWPDRHRLAVAKLASQILPGMNDRQLAGLLLQPGSTAADHQFIEVHIWGEMTRRTFESVTLNARPTSRRSKVTRERIVADKLARAGVKIEWIG